MLVDSRSISLPEGEQKAGSTKWIAKVSNLKQILTKISNFMELFDQNANCIRDINVVQTAKFAFPSHLAKLFEVVDLVLMSSTSKERYIQLIMTPDEDVQNTIVEIIKNSLNEQIFPSQQSSSFFRLEQELSQIKRENGVLRNELNYFSKKYQILDREAKDLRDKVLNYDQEVERGKRTYFSSNSDSLQSQLQQQRVLIDNLKIKLISTVRQSELEQLSQLREQASLFCLKNKNMQQMEATLDRPLPQRHLSYFVDSSGTKYVFNCISFKHTSNFS